MMGLLTLVPKPYLYIGLALALVTTHSFAYFKGYKRAEDAQAALIVKQWEKERELQQAYDHASRELVKAYQTKQAKSKIVYRTIREIVDETTSGAVCINDNAARLWDNALIGSMPDATARTTETPTGAYTDAEVLNNAVENFEQYKDCRDQLNALIDWHEKVEAVDAAK